MRSKIPSTHVSIPCDGCWIYKSNQRFRLNRPTIPMTRQPLTERMCKWRCLRGVIFFTSALFNCTLSGLKETRHCSIECRLHSWLESVCVCGYEPSLWLYMPLEVRQMPYLCVQNWTKKVRLLIPSNYKTLASNQTMDWGGEATHETGRERDMIELTDERQPDSISINARLI